MFFEGKKPVKWLDDRQFLFSEMFNPLWMDEMSAPKNLGHTQLIAERDH